MTRIPIWCEIVCRECSVTCSGQFTYDAIPRKQLKEIAKSQGWRLHDDECFCSEKMYATLQG